jgi:hypothetical protein
MPAACNGSRLKIPVGHQCNRGRDRPSDGCEISDIENGTNTDILVALVVEELVSQLYAK